MTMINMRPVQCLYEKKKGFTLIELLVTLAISSILLLAIGNFFIATNKANTIQEKVAATQQGIRASMELMSRDIRMAGLDPTGDAGAGFVDNGTNDDQTDGDSISIRYDYSGDGANDVNVCYYVDVEDEKLMYRNGGSNQPLTEDGSIESLDFEYTLNDDSTETNPSGDDLDDIKEVKITINGKISGAYADDLINNLSFSNTVKVRNM